MKKILIAILLCLPLLTSGQILNTEKQYVVNPHAYIDQTHAVYGFHRINKAEQWKSLAMNLAAVTFNAVGDGLLDQGRQEDNFTMMKWGHTFRAASVGTILMKPVVQRLDRKEWLIDLLSYTCIRIGTFNMTYNTVRGLPPYYLGTTSWYDTILRKLDNPHQGYMFMNGISFIVGVTIPFTSF
jgi:hypothetical protein